MEQDALQHRGKHCTFHCTAQRTFGWRKMDLYKNGGPCRYVARDTPEHFKSTEQHAGARPCHAKPQRDIHTFVQQAVYGDGCAIKDRFNLYEGFICKNLSHITNVRTSADAPALDYCI